MKKLLFLALFVFFATSIKAQTQYNIDINDVQVMMDRNSTVSIEDRKDVKGSQYIQDDFEPVKLKGVDAIIPGKFNAYLGEIHLKVDDEYISLDINKDYEVNFTLHNKLYKTFSYKSISRTTSRGFLLVLEETDEFSLLKEEIIVFKEKIPAENSYVREVPAKFVKGKDAYYLKLNEEIVNFPTNKKELLKTFPEISKKIKSFIKNNKLSTKKEEDLIKIATYIASLSDKSETSDSTTTEVKKTKKDLKENRP